MREETGGRRQAGGDRREETGGRRQAGGDRREELRGKERRLLRGTRFIPNNSGPRLALLVINLWFSFGEVMEKGTARTTDTMHVPSPQVVLYSDSQRARDAVVGEVVEPAATGGFRDAARIRLPHYPDSPQTSVWLMSITTRDSEAPH